MLWYSTIDIIVHIHHSLFKHDFQKDFNSFFKKDLDLDLNPFEKERI